MRSSLDPLHRRVLHFYYASYVRSEYCVDSHAGKWFQNVAEISKKNCHRPNPFLTKSLNARCK